MPIVHIHGVATRNATPSDTIAKLMRRYLSDVVSPGGELHVEYAFWGDVAAKFAWGGASRPRTPLRGMGGVAELDAAGRTALAVEMADMLGGLPETATPAIADGGLVAAGPRSGPSADPGFRLRDLTPEQLSDLLASTVLSTGDGGRQAELLIAADEVARDPATPARLGAAPDLDSEWAIVAKDIEERLPREDLAGMGGDGFLSRLGDRVKEAAGRGVGVPGYVASRVVAEFREPINDMASLFVGDVFAYLHDRGDAGAVGEIPMRLLCALRRARDAAPPEEPLVVVSHSMGGQIVYDAVTHFLPKLADFGDLRVDYWCATASQVGLFEELKLFLESSKEYATGSKVPFPGRLGGWWNVWDHNDFISYTGKDIFDGIDDEPFDTGMTLIGAHSGYLVRPSFYRRLAGKLRDAAEAGWHR